MDVHSLIGAPGMEVVSSLQRDASPIVRDLRWGVYVTCEANSEYAARCFGECGVVTDQRAALYRPHHFIGLGLEISVASVVLRGEPTGAACARMWSPPPGAIFVREKPWMVKVAIGSGDVSCRHAPA